MGLNVGFDDLRQSFLETFAVNVFGAACMAAALLPSLKRSNQAGGGRILNVSSGLASITLMSDPNGPYAEMHSLVSFIRPVNFLCTIPTQELTPSVRCMAPQSPP